MQIYNLATNIIITYLFIRYKLEKKNLQILALKNKQKNKSNFCLYPYSAPILIPNIQFINLLFIINAIFNAINFNYNYSNNLIIFKMLFIIYY